jgi:hypothetical protein
LDLDGIAVDNIHVGGVHGLAADKSADSASTAIDAIHRIAALRLKRSPHESE